MKEIVYSLLYDTEQYKRREEEVAFPLCSFMCFMSIKLMRNDSCKVVAKVAHFNLFLPLNITQRTIYLRMRIMGND